MLLWVRLQDPGFDRLADDDPVVREAATRSLIGRALRSDFLAGRISGRLRQALLRREFEVAARCRAILVELRDARVLGLIRGEGICGGCRSRGGPRG